MSWKTKARYLPAIVTDTTPYKGMINHTIKKHSEESNKRHYTPSIWVIWEKEKCEKYLQDIASKGYTVGARVITKYKIPGTINDFKPIEEKGWEISHVDASAPNVIFIKTNAGHVINIAYNTDEINLIGEQNGC
jgi:hypothetical protein